MTDSQEISYNIRIRASSFRSTFEPDSTVLISFSDTHDHIMIVDLNSKEDKPYFFIGFINWHVNDGRLEIIECLEDYTRVKHSFVNTRIDLSNT